MPDLTPEERQLIYLEEKARLEAGRELEPRIRTGRIAGYVALGIVGIIVLYLIGSSSSVQRSSNTKTVQTLPPSKMPNGYQLTPHDMEILRRPETVEYLDRMSRFCQGYRIGAGSTDPKILQECVTVDKMQEALKKP